MRIRIPRASAVLAACLFLLAAPLTAQQGMISGIVFDVETEDGEPATNIPIALVGTSGTSQVATTGSTGSGTVPYTTAHPRGTQVQVLAITAPSGLRIELVPEGQTSESCEEARQQDEEECDELTVIGWGVTASHQLRLGGMASQFLDSRRRDGRPSQEIHFSPGSALSNSAGVFFGRSRELAAFRYGVQGTVLIGEVLEDSQFGVTGVVTRSSIGMDVSVWIGEVFGELRKPINERVSLVGRAGLAFDRQNSEFASGTDIGPTANVGLNYSVSGAQLQATLGWTDRRNSSDLGFGVGIARNW